MQTHTRDGSPAWTGKAGNTRWKKMMRAESLCVASWRPIFERRHGWRHDPIYSDEENEYSLNLIW
jgi:hypothetical protein